MTSTGIASSIDVTPSLGRFRLTNDIVFLGPGFFEYTMVLDNLDDDALPYQLGPIGVERELPDMQVIEFLLRGATTEGAQLHGDVFLDYFSLVATDGAPGDFSGDSSLTTVDLDMLLLATRIDRVDPVFDLNSDQVVDASDVTLWLRDLKKTFVGDVDLDGEFASADLVSAFAEGEYEDGAELNSTWASGDWNGDGDFTSSDLVLAFQDGGYEQGPRAAASIPEPGSVLSLLAAVVCFFVRQQIIL